MTNLVYIVLFSSRNSLAEIKSLLDRIEGWSLTVYAPEHLIKHHGIVEYESWGGSISGEYNGAELWFTIEGRNYETRMSCYRVTLTYPNDIQTLFQKGDEDRSWQNKTKLIDDELESLLGRLDGVILSDQD
jgi:hypothetical protein